MDVIILYAAVISVITVAAVQLVKKTTNIPSKLMPAVSTVIGIAVGVTALFIPEITGDLSIGGHILAGAISGLAASGLFDLTTKTKQGFNETE